MPRGTDEGLDIRFASRNEHKLAEAETILAAAKVQVVPLVITVEELQTEDTESLVKDKTLKAFQVVGRPLFVEHTGLYLSHINGLPAGLTQVFWDRLKADRFAELFGDVPDPTARAKTIIGFTDSKQYFTFEGEVSGIIVSRPRGPRGFQWDCVFQPDGYEKTFAEMGEAKNNISMRRLALNNFAEFLLDRGRA